MSPILLALVLGLVGVLIYKNWPRSRQKKNTPPGPPRLPFFGSYLHLLWIDYRRPHLALTKLKNFYNSPVISFGMGKFNAVVANDYDTCKEVFNNPDLQGRVIVWPGLIRTFGEPNGFFGDDGPRWLHMRRNALRALRDLGFGRRSETFESVMEEEVGNLVEFINNTKGEAIQMPEALFHTILNMINHILHGFRFPPSQRNILTNLGKSALRIPKATDATGRFIAAYPWMRYLFPITSGAKELIESSQELEAYIKNSFKKHNADFDEEVLRDLMDYYLKHKKIYPDWTDEEIWASCMDLTFPNTTLGVTTTFTLAYLAEQPDIMKKCQQQIDEIVGRGRLPTLNDRQYLTMVEASIREALRLNPLTPLGAAHRATADTTLGGYFVQQDSLVITNMHAMNHDPLVWKDPNVFRPERFLEPGAKDTTLPFGLGKRVCAGETYARQNLFILVAAILQNFDLELPNPLDPEKYIYSLVTAPPEDFTMRFKPRA